MEYKYFLAAEAVGVPIGDELKGEDASRGTACMEAADVFSPFNCGVSLGGLGGEDEKPPTASVEGPIGDEWYWGVKYRGLVGTGVFSFLNCTIVLGGPREDDDSDTSGEGADSSGDLCLAVKWRRVFAASTAEEEHTVPGIEPGALV